MSLEPAWSQNRAKRMVVLMLSASVSLWLVLLLPFDEPWNWLLVGLFLALAAAFIRLAALFVLQQRNDSWRDHKRDTGG
ncbi:hypothetical protein [Arthrobacter sp. zg-Y877]|uniref:hypothetical protein n=1 Tax=Arthrobacter sp. zg-Y877 TaxID=3049074 RepID=UPI0025A3B213|nr:hypothetical protein [Arthrobacter sp. zg-Y877]MDM7988989.1 hypothetical protein [Arthrobacter sp. zg-Y877]